MIVGMLRYRIFCKCMNINVEDHCILTNIKYHILQILVLAILRLLHECVERVCIPPGIVVLTRVKLDKYLYKIYEFIVRD
jgi:hypothetical protein